MNQSRKKISLLFVTRIMLYNKIDFHFQKQAEYLRGMAIATLETHNL